MYGQPDKYHRMLRKDTVEYMRQNAADFEPFFVPEEDGQSFERHLDLLEEDGVFAGNDALAAFARRFQVSIVIHQLNEPVWKIGLDDPQSRQLHVSYHNGDHYNSVRKLGDLQGPANVCVRSSNAERESDDSEEPSVVDQIRSSLWQDGGTGERIFGSEVAQAASGNRKGKKQTKRQRKRHEQRQEEDDQIAASLQTLTI